MHGRRRPELHPIILHPAVIFVVFDISQLREDIVQMHSIALYYSSSRPWIISWEAVYFIKYEIHSCESGLWGHFPSHSSLGRDCEGGRRFERMDLTWKWHPTSLLLWALRVLRTQQWGCSQGSSRIPNAHTADCTAKEENFFLLFLAGEFLSHLQRIFPLWPGTHGRRQWGWLFSSSTLSPRLNRALDQEISTELCKRRELSALVCVCVCFFSFHHTNEICRHGEETESYL